MTVISITYYKGMNIAFSVFRVYRIQQRWNSLHARVQNQLIPRLTSQSYQQEAVTLTQATELHTEVRLVETNQAFQNAQDCLEWIQKKQVILYKIN